MTPKRSPRRILLAMGLVALAASAAACAAGKDGAVDETDERAAESIKLTCRPPAIKDCTYGDLLYGRPSCTCTEPDPVCRTLPGTNPPALATCEPGFQIHAAKMWLCPDTLPTPTTIFGMSYERVMRFEQSTDPNASPQCEALHPPTGDVCYYADFHDPCVDPAPVGKVWIADWIDPPPGSHEIIAGGCKGPCDIGFTRLGPGH